MQEVMHVVRLVEGEDGGHGERTCLSTHPHWFWALSQGFLGLALLAAGLTVMLFGTQIYHLLRGWVPRVLALPGTKGEANPGSSVASGFDLSLSAAFTWGPIILIFLGSIMLGWALLQRHFTEYAITISPSPHFGGRIIKAQGVISRQTVAVPLMMVNDLVVQEPLLGRILGWGHVDIETGNDYQGDRLEYMPNPRRFYEIWTIFLANGYGGRDRRDGRDGRDGHSEETSPFATRHSAMRRETEAKPGDGVLIKRGGPGRSRSAGAIRRRRPSRGGGS